LETALCLAMAAGVIFTAVWPGAAVARGGGGRANYIVVIATVIAGAEGRGPSGWAVAHGLAAAALIATAAVVWVAAAARTAVRGWGRALTRTALVLTAGAFAAGFALTVAWRHNAPWLIQALPQAQAAAGLDFGFLAYPFILFATGYVCLSVIQWARRDGPPRWRSAALMMATTIVWSLATVVLAGEPLGGGPDGGPDQTVLGLALAELADGGYARPAAAIVVAFYVGLAAAAVITLAVARRGRPGQVGLAVGLLGIGFGLTAVAFLTVLGSPPGASPHQLGLAPLIGGGLQATVIIVLSLSRPRRAPSPDRPPPAPSARLGDQVAPAGPPDRPSPFGDLAAADAPPPPA
jgi:hypothetical protein